MSVLDVGSGLGDVALLAGKLVSPGGRVLGIERSMEGIAIAKQRAAAFPEIDVRFEVADLDAYEPQQTFDALVGRFVLAYLKEPSAALRRLAKSVRPGGIVAMVEFDVRVMCVSPHSPLHLQVIDWIVGAFEGSASIRVLVPILRRSFMTRGCLGRASDPSSMQPQDRTARFGIMAIS
jgi:ubiquinone/menaquinone biosynthesis C-methylase UbiE